MTRLHDAQLAGRWYAGSRAALEAQLTRLFSSVPSGVQPGPTAAVVVPHAGYQYSGSAAAHAYAKLRGLDCRRTVILAPSHHVAMRGVAMLDWDGFTTPLGTVRIDRAAVSALCQQPLFCIDAAPFAGEHALEIQLPFVRSVLPDVPVLPLLVGHLAAGDAAQLAAALQQQCDRQTLCIVSSDLTHYGRHFDYVPFAARDADSVKRQLHDLDQPAIDAVCAADGAAFHAYVAATGATICGRAPIEVFLSLHQRRSRGALLSYYTSLDLTGDYEHSVSYAAIHVPPG
jgi:AmmeMemoRadiSam system protein B